MRPRSSTAPRRSSCRTSFLVVCLGVASCPSRCCFLERGGTLLRVRAGRKGDTAPGVFLPAVASRSVPTNGEVSATRGTSWRAERAWPRAPAAAVQEPAGAVSARLRGGTSCGMRAEIPRFTGARRAAAADASIGGFPRPRGGRLLLVREHRPQLLPASRRGPDMLHVRAPVGMRIEETAARFCRGGKGIRPRSSRRAENGGGRRTTSAPIFRRSIPSTTIPAPSGRRTGISRSRSPRGSAHGQVRRALRKQLPAAALPA